MKTLKKVEIEPVFVEFVPDVLEENKIYISEEYKCAIHNCLCGCGEKTVMPLYSNGWNLIKESNGKVSFTPSVGNYNFQCKSHYIITNNVANFV
jgi:hypothetical protein